MGVNPHVVVRRLSTVIVPIPRNIGFFLNEVIGKKTERRMTMCVALSVVYSCQNKMDNIESGNFRTIYISVYVSQ